MINEPLTESQKIFLTFMFGFAGSLLGNFIFRQTTTPVTPVAREESPAFQIAGDLEDE